MFSWLEGVRMIKVQEIKEFQKIWDIISEQAYSDGIDRYRSSYLYRGLPNIGFHLETSLARNCKHKGSVLEKAILRNFTKYASIEDPKLTGSVWRQLIIGQHHGLPTRLLDWTYSPLTALHFATSGEPFTQMAENDCVVWAIDIEEINELLPDDYQNKLKEEWSYLFTVEMLDEVVQCLDKYDDDMKSDAMILVEPPSIDQRIINQYSYFSVIPKNMDSIEAFLDAKTEHTSKYIIDKSLKWRIRDMLDQLNVNERIVYPGLDGLSSWIKRHYYVK